MKNNKVGLLGGLGNQLFQLAFGIWLEDQTGLPTTYDLSAFKKIPGYFSLGSLSKQHLPLIWVSNFLPCPRGSFPKVAVILRRILTPRLIVHEDELRKPIQETDLLEPGWYFGYWQSADFTLNSTSRIRDALFEVAPAMRKNSKGIAIHVRRGDMVSQSATVDETYFAKALDHLMNKHNLSQKIPIRIYSDDPHWCKSNLNLPSAEYVTGNSAITDLTELASHEYLVLSGSTFSWWAANLRERNPDTVVVPWPFIPDFDPRLENENWLRIPRH